MTLLSWYSFCWPSTLYLFSIVWRSLSTKLTITTQHNVVGVRGVTLLFASGDDGAPSEYARQNASFCSPFNPGTIPLCCCLQCCLLCFVVGAVDFSLCCVAWFWFVFTLYIHSLFRRLTTTTQQNTTGFPSASPYVTTVGGTQLTRVNLPVSAGNSGWLGDVAEAGCDSRFGGVITSGGGFSRYYSTPDYQVSPSASFVCKYVFADVLFVVCVRVRVCASVCSARL